MRELPPIERHWLLLRTLSARKPGCAVGELAVEFGVNEKTIRRDLGQLKRLGFPLEERAEEYGRKRWRVRKLKGCPDLSFDLTEILSLFLARRLLEPLAGSYFWDGAQSAFRKVRATLGNDAVRYLDRLGGLIHDPHQRTSDYRDHGEIIDKAVVLEPHVLVEALRAEATALTRCYPTDADDVKNCDDGFDDRIAVSRKAR